MAEHAKVIPNNCVSEIKIPRSVGRAHGVDYNPVLDLYATFDYDERVSLWNPVSGSVVAELRGFGALHDPLFVPGDNDSDREDEGDEEEDEDEDSTPEIVIEDKDFLMADMPGAIALSPAPGRNLLVTDTHGGCVYEIFIDWDTLKVLKWREVFPEDEEVECGIHLLCCSADFKVTIFSFDLPFISTVKVCLNSEGKVELQEQEKITYYMLNGEEKRIDKNVTGLVHDGENLIIANEGEIVLLESTTEGSNAHLIASDVKPTGQIRLNHEGQLIVCEEKVIKLFEYKCNPRSLQDLCRCLVRKAICSGYIDKVNSLVIPSLLRNYLLFK
ncbi:uncharacterized protein LOC144643482 [Oculina patagonica]